MYVGDNSQKYLFYIYNHTLQYLRFIARIINIESGSSYFITDNVYDSFLWYKCKIINIKNIYIPRNPVQILDIDLNLSCVIAFSVIISARFALAYLMLCHIQIKVTRNIFQFWESTDILSLNWIMTEYISTQMLSVFYAQQANLYEFVNNIASKMINVK